MTTVLVTEPEAVSVKVDVDAVVTMAAAEPVGALEALDAVAGKGERGREGGSW